MRKSLKMAKDSSSLVRPRKRKGLNIWPRLFLTDDVSNWSRFTDKTDKCWLLLLSFLILFSSSFPKSPCPTQALRCFWCFCWLSKFFFQPENFRFLPQGSATHTLVKVAYVSNTREWKPHKAGKNASIPGSIVWLSVLIVDVGGSSGRTWISSLGTLRELSRRILTWSTNARGWLWSHCGSGWLYCFNSPVVQYCYTALWASLKGLYRIG